MKIIVKYFKGIVYTNIKHIRHPFGPEWMKDMDIENFDLWELTETDIQRIASIPYFIRCINPETLNQVNKEYCLIKLFTEQAYKQALKEIKDIDEWHKANIARMKDVVGKILPTHEPVLK